MVGANRTFPLLGFEGLFWNLNNHVLLYGDLTRKAAALASFTFVDVTFFGRENISSTFVDFDETLSASPTTTASRRNKDPAVCQCPHEFPTSGNLDFLLIVDQDFHVAGGNQKFPSEQDDSDQHQDNGGEYEHAK